MQFWHVGWLEQTTTLWKGLLYQKEFVLQEQGGRAFPVAIFTVFNMLLLRGGRKKSILWCITILSSMILNRFWACLSHPYFYSTITLNYTYCVLSPRGLEFMSSLDLMLIVGLFVAFYCKKSGKEVRTCRSSWSNSLKVVSEHVHFDLKWGNEEVCRLPWSGSQLVSAVMWGCVSVYSLDVYIEFCFKPLVVF